MPRSLGARSHLLGGWYTRSACYPCKGCKRPTQTSSWLQLACPYFLLWLVLFHTMIARCGALNGSDPMVIGRTGNETTADDRACSIEETKLNNFSVVRICDCLSRLNGREKAQGFIRMFNLEFCDVIHVQDAVSILVNATICKEKLYNILVAEQNALEAYNNFLGIMERVDCTRPYSVKWKCSDCEAAYKDWVCHSEVLPTLSPKRPAPCISMCHKVLQRCPYFLPGAEYQWSGQSAFECPDPEDEGTNKHQECINMTDPVTARPTLAPPPQSTNSQQIEDANLNLKKDSTS